MNTLNTLDTSEQATISLAHYVRMVGYLVKQNLGESYVCIRLHNLQCLFKDGFNVAGAALTIIDRVKKAKDKVLEADMLALLNNKYSTDLPIDDMKCISDTFLDCFANNKLEVLTYVSNDLYKSLLDKYKMNLARYEELLKEDEFGMPTEEAYWDLWLDEERLATITSGHLLGSFHRYFYFRRENMVDAREVTVDLSPPTIRACLKLLKGNS